MVRRSPLDSFSPVPNPEGFREPTDGSERYLPYGAIPANPYLDDAVRARQEEINTELQKLFDFPPEGIPEGFVRMLNDDRIIHEQRRTMLNYGGYHEWLRTGEIVSPELSPTIDHVTRGTAYVDETFMYGLGTNVENWEAGKVTHPYRRRLEHVKSLRIDTDSAILKHGGDVYLRKDVNYRSIDIRPYVEYDQHGNLVVHGFIVPYKRDAGIVELPDGLGVAEVIERQLTGFRADEASGFNQDVIARMKKSDVRWDQQWHDARYRDALAETGCRGFIERAVQADSLEAFVEPIETVIYASKVYSPQQGTLLGNSALRSVNL